MTINVPAFLTSEAQQQGVVQPSRYLFLSLRHSKAADIPGPEAQAGQQGEGGGAGPLAAASGPLGPAGVQPLGCSFTAAQDYGVPGLQLVRLLGRGQYGSVYLGSWRGEKVGLGGCVPHAAGRLAAPAAHSTILLAPASFATIHPMQLPLSRAGPLQGAGAPGVGPPGKPRHSRAGLGACLLQLALPPPPPPVARRSRSR
jgi:hypothetical protein